MFVSAYGPRRIFSFVLEPVFSESIDARNYLTRCILMFDMAAWTARAKTFIRRMATLPGNINLDDSIDRPATSEFTLERLDAKSGALPPEIQRFLREASEWCGFWYEWTAPANWQHALHDTWKPTAPVTGGANLCEVNIYCLYDYQNVLPLAPLENNYQLALELHPDEARRSVVYMPSNGVGPRHKISDGFVQFLHDWERVCYLTPCYETLRPWLDTVTGLLRPTDQQVEQLRAFFSGLPRAN